MEIEATVALACIRRAWEQFEHEGGVMDSNAFAHYCLEAMGDPAFTPAPTAALQEAVEALSDDDVRWVMKAVDAPIARARLAHLLRRVASVAAGDLIGENDADR